MFPNPIGFDINCCQWNSHLHCCHPWWRLFCSSSYMLIWGQGYVSHIHLTANENWHHKWKWRRTILNWTELSPPTPNPYWKAVAGIIKITFSYGKIVSMNWKIKVLKIGRRDTELTGYWAEWFFFLKASMLCWLFGMIYSLNKLLEQLTKCIHRHDYVLYWVCWWFDMPRICGIYTLLLGMTDSSVHVLLSTSLFI